MAEELKKIMVRVSDEKATELKEIFRRTGVRPAIWARQAVYEKLERELKKAAVSRIDGSEKVTERGRITPKGQAKLATVFQEAA